MPQSPQPQARLTTLHCAAVTQAEIEGLYKRFRTLDRGHKAGTRASCMQEAWLCPDTERPDNTGLQDSAAHRRMFAFAGVLVNRGGDCPRYRSQVQDWSRNSSGRACVS